MQGSISAWEMESMNFYYHEHELQNVNTEKYGIVDYNTLSEEPTIVGYSKRGNIEYPKFELTRICGTILDKDKNKHLLTVLTPTGVVNVKFYAGQFSFYDKQISQVNADDTKTVIEESFFKRGNKLLITGFRRGDQFKPKRYYDSIYQHSVQKITEVKDNGDLVLVGDRATVENNG